MQWYYVRNGQSTGPVDLATFESLVRQGVINGDTLVWREGMAEWKPYVQAEDMVPQSLDAAADAPAAAAGESTSGADSLASQRPCAMCGKFFSEQDLMRYEDSFVCASCKPDFVQHIKEGSVLVGSAVYAGFWIRFLATFIDGIVLGIFNFFIGLLLGFGIAAVETDAARIGLTVAVYLVQFGTQAIYEIVLIHKYGATLGKMACKIKVVTADGQGLTVMRAVGRHFAKYISQLIVFIGYLMAGFDKEKRGLHDHICSTRVIRV